MTHHDRHTDADATRGGATFTPGPWTATRTEDPAIQWWISACPAANMEKDICVLHGDREAATARLIAAAPDLFAALKRLDDWWTADHPAGPQGDPKYSVGVLSEGTLSIWRDIRAALSLATRREPSDAGRVQDGETA